MKFLVVVLATLATLVAADGGYKGYKIYDVTVTNSIQEAALRSIGNSGEFDFWSPSRVLVKPEQIAKFEGLLKTGGIDFQVFVDDVDEFARKEKAENEVAESRAEGRLSFTAYHRYDVIQQYLSEMASKHPDLAKVETIGTSSEGRPIKALRLSSGGNGSKPVVVMDAAIHAREWLAPTTALYLIDQILENGRTSLLTKLDWVIIPVLNPDGYEYSHTGDRFWRKTRSKNQGSSCMGTDGNRNFDFHWMEVGASNSPCSDTFAGNRPFSEPETSALRDLLLRSNVKLYLTIHTYGQYFLYPWGYTSALPDNWKDLDALGRQAASAIQGVIGTRYTVGSSTNVLYAAAGGSDDYALAVGKAPYSYTIELPGGGSGGFNPPPSSILPVCQERWQLLLWLPSMSLNFMAKM
ncbi:carboxypeptidase B-like [Ctenocephalides felis]|uniref:carboxypeptidase B-like n=1 Tax=Ctenocephalides felis TaxID=7515 RepID=UPI000E6E5754|nr:carboxypeptidase B-like [Ctenocephalides felis]